jgi:hypothetical protein
MERPDKDKWLDDALAKTIGSERRRSDFAKWKADHPEAVKILKSGAQRQIWHRSPFEMGRIIMINPITKFAAAAVIIIAVVLSIVFVDKSVTPSYALVQTIQANQGIDCLNFKYYDPCSADKVLKDAWIQHDANGNVKKIRVDMHGSYVLGDVAEVWSEGKFLVWDKCTGTLSIMESDLWTAKMLKFAQRFDPRQAIEHLYKMQQEGKATIDIQEGSNKDEPIRITGRYLPGTYIIGNPNVPEVTDVLFVDPGTKLVTKIEVYMDVNGQTSYRGVYKDFNYMPFDPNIFDIEKDVPDDVMRIVYYNYDDVNNFGVDVNDLAAKVGNCAGKMAVEIAREFFDALIVKDYKRAGRLFGGMPADKAEIRFGGYNVVRVVSIGEEPVKDAKYNLHYFPCVVEIEENGTVNQLETKVFAVGPVDQSGGRRMWIINIIW